MVNRILRVDKKEFEDKIDDLKVEGFKVHGQTDNTSILKKHDVGSIGMHLIIFLFTALWTYGIINIIYGAYRYFFRSDEVQIKIKGV